MNEILLTGLAVAVIVMIALDIIEKVQAYRIKKAEKKIVEPRVTRRPCNPYPLKAKVILRPGDTPDEVENKLAEIFKGQIIKNNLMDIYRYVDFKTNEVIVEATLRVVDPMNEEANNGNNKQ